MTEIVTRIGVADAALEQLRDDELGAFNATEMRGWLRSW
jgi:hypothetical protein